MFSFYYDYKLFHLIPSSGVAKGPHLAPVLFVSFYPASLLAYTDDIKI